MRDKFFVYSIDQETGADDLRSITASEADHEYRETDAGVNIDQQFVVIAFTFSGALEGARRWRAVWKDELQSCVPDDLALEEREYRPRKTYMILRVM